MRAAVLPARDDARTGFDASGNVAGDGLNSPKEIEDQ
jgi:hypothetical protein